MITKALKDALTSVKKHFWMLLAMVIPAFLVSFFLEWLVSIISGASFISMSSFNHSLIWPGHALTFALINFLVDIVVVVLIESYLMGFLESDETGKFRFENAFAAFNTGKTWLVSALYAVFMNLIEFAFIAVTSLIFGILLGVGSISIGNAISGNGVNGWEVAAVVILAIIIAIVIAVIGIFIGTGLAFVYLSYFDEKRKNNDTSVMDGFPKSWKLMKGNRWNLIGLILLTTIIGFVGYLVISLVGLLIWWLFATLLSWNFFAVLLELVVVIAAIVYGIFISIWFRMANIKFFEAINK